MCDALFFNKRAYENHNLFHKNDDVFVENEQERYDKFSQLDLHSSIPKHITLYRQALVTRVDQDFDYRRVQSQTEKFIPKPEIANRGRKRKPEASEAKSTAVRWVINFSRLIPLLIEYQEKLPIIFLFNFVSANHLFHFLKAVFNTTYLTLFLNNFLEIFLRVKNSSAVWDQRFRQFK